MIRRATSEDVEAIVAMGLCFQATTNYAQHLRATPETLRSLAMSILANDQSVIFLAERERSILGMIAASLYLQPMSGELVGTEICWWMNPDARGGRTALRLIRAAEAWAVSRGAVVFQLMAPTAKVGQFYEALHYDLIETHYQRRVA